MPIDAKPEEMGIPDESYTPPPSMARSASDWATSFIRGLAKGGVSAIGTPGDVGSLAQEYLGVPEAPQKVGKPHPGAHVPTTSELIEAAPQPVSEFLKEKPSTRTGEYIQSVGEFAAPSALGKGKLARKALSAVGGGIGSEKAGELAESYLGPWAGPLGRLLGGALGGGAGSATKMRRTPPTMEELKAASDQAYKEAAALPLQLDPKEIGKLHRSIVADLHTLPTRQILAPQTFSLTDELLNPAGKNVTVSDIDSVRQMLGQITDPRDKRAANLVRQRIDDYLADIPEGHVVSGDPKPVSEIFKRARGNYAPMKRAEEIEDAMYAARLNAASAGSGANLDNQIRQQIKAILKSDNRRRGFSDDEIKQMERIVEGGPIRDIARKVGKLAPTGVVSAVPTILAKLGGGNLPAAALAGTGFAGKNLSEYLTKKGVRDLDEMIRSRAQMHTGGPIGLGPTPEAAALQNIIRSALAERIHDQGNWVVEPGEGIEGSTRIRPNR